jgi:uncharacterized protein YbcI
MDAPHTVAARESHPLSAITRELVRLHAEYFGKGPPRARSYQVSPDVVVSILRDALTPVERTLIDRGQGEQVHALRRSFQGVMEPEYRALVERALGRPVTAFMSQVTLDPDIAAELFFLEPLTPDGSGSAPEK